MPVWKKSQDGKLTITDENANGKLIATGGVWGWYWRRRPGNGKTSPSPAARSQLPVAAMDGHRWSYYGNGNDITITGGRSQLPAAIAQRAWRRQL